MPFSSAVTVTVCTPAETCTAFAAAGGGGERRFSANDTRRSTAGLTAPDRAGAGRAG